MQKERTKTCSSGLSLLIAIPYQCCLLSGPLITIKFVFKAVLRVDVEKMLLLLLLIIKSAGTVSTAWTVTFENSDVCALRGSSVKFKCSYNYSLGETIRNTAWYKGYLENGIWKRVALSVLPSYNGRSEYLGDQQHNCSLAIHDLQDNDTGHYYFKFDTDLYGRRSKNSVYLSVTELRARVQPQRVRAGERVTLECITSCQLGNTVWFKDGHPVAKTLFQAQAEDAGNYACSLEGQESLQSHPVVLNVQYSPLNVSVEANHAGPLTVGSSVNLTCNSTANPQAENYTWYNSISLLPVASGQVLSLNSLKVSHSGLYLCQARNRLGGNNSTELLLTVEETDINRFILLVGIGVKVVIVLLLSLVFIWAWRRRHNSTANNEMDSHDYENVRKSNR